MKKWFEWKGGKRLLSLALSVAMVLSLLPAGVLAEEETPVCSCVEVCAEADCPVCAGDADACAVKPEPTPEPQQEPDPAPDPAPDPVPDLAPDPEPCAHGNDPAVCEACVSEARVAAVQALIDELPDADSITLDDAGKVGTKLDEIDEIAMLLTEAELAELDCAKYDTAAARLSELAEQENPEQTAVWDTATNVAASSSYDIAYQWYQVTTGEGEVPTESPVGTGESYNLPVLDVGSYQYFCRLTCDGYVLNSEPVTVTVNKAPNDWTTTPAIDGWTYGDTPSTPTAAATFGTVTVEYKSKDGTTSYGTTPPTNAGSYTARFTVAETKNFKLVSYGTVAQWKDTLAGKALTLSTGNPGYAYDADGGKDPIFGRSGGRVQYTNVLVWDKLDDEQYAKEIVMRPFIKLRNGTQELVIYGGTVSRSIGYVAQQNAKTFPKGSAGYNYVHEIINKVSAPPPSTDTTTGGNVG